MDVFEKVKKLNLPKDKYTVFGGGVLEALGIRKSGDVDLVVTKDIYDKLKENRWKEMIRPDGTKSLKENNFDIATNLNCEGYKASTKYLLEKSSLIKGVPFVNLEEIIKFKKCRNSKKDKNDIKLIKQHLQSQTHRGS
ncbi:zinc ABC transporter substrate-binding protein [Patescibacteria group bacterium]|nr:zinc ABC transporter substrate-binding protein [Patescibacteria group bacterium]MBU0777053.1 zinc ABC transporter substrate-binding protein [Patescibacteria group bacterium]MBU0845747.1 zinc ABC transporter substrate-binding protein [Patescibacteria group bacterium]MBU0923203.1 zinc ABC transporter substrate-binding protein [Patescibacteria group bacterium]MBU1066493.1 zinc ABC transporter substrate-binding protein [Patescibacteria group bacterium]